MKGGRTGKGERQLLDLRQKELDDDNRDEEGEEGGEGGEEKELEEQEEAAARNRGEEPSQEEDVSELETQKMQETENICGR